MYRENRKRKILSMIDSIVEGKRKKRVRGTEDTAETYEEEKEKVKDEMFEAIRDTPREHRIVQTFTGK